MLIVLLCGFKCGYKNGGIMRKHDFDALVANFCERQSPAYN